jgi:hypothetical protein
MSLSSRRTWLLLAACVAAPVDARIPLDYRLPPATEPALRLDMRPGCPPADSPEEIVVCGSRDDERYRVEPSEPVPGARRRLIAGEPPTGAGALADGALSRCTTVGPNQQCTQGLDLFGIAFGIARLIARARANR